MVMLPTGTVTYVMTDIVGSSPLWERNAEAMNTAVRDHEQIARVCAANNNGHLIKERGEGDSLFLVFDSAHNAVQMALDFQRALSVAEWPEGMPISVRCAIHTGASMVRDNDYYGPPVNRCARLRSVAGPGQIVISNATVHLLGDRLPEGSALKDLGLHRLRDLLRPERLYELTHPELKSSGETILTLNKVQHNLPIQLTSFVGREEDVRRVAGLVRMTRLVTLTGSGGCGKTRLALQVASESCDEFPDGVWFVDLTQVAPGENCDAAVARALGIHAPAQGSSRQQLVESLSFREALLILDNCEHVVDTAAELVTDLLAAGESLKILATSRELLRVPGELRWRVPPMRLWRRRPPATR